MTGYLYDAEGNRIAKGTIQLVGGQLSCDTTQNGFTVTQSYILGPGGQQLTEMTWSGGVASWGPRCNSTCCKDTATEPGRTYYGGIIKDWAVLCSRNSNDVLRWDEG